MTREPEDDEVVARLRATFDRIAARTPTGVDRFDELLFASASNRPRTLVAVGSAAAAVTAVAAVATAVAAAHSGGSGVGGTQALDGTTVSASASASTPTPSPGCTPRNYYVIASPQQLAGMTYLLPSPPAGYHLYGAWGTIDSSGCLDTAQWYVQYDPDSSGGATTGAGSIQLNVSRLDAAGSVLPLEKLVPSAGSAGAPPSPVPAVSAAVGANGSTYWWVPKGGAVMWETGGLHFDVVGAPTMSKAALLDLAGSVVAVNPDDPRIVAPANCRVPPGNVCGSPTSLGSQTPTPSPTPSP